jgi:hypothetical protein
VPRRDRHRPPTRTRKQERNKCNGYSTRPPSSRHDRTRQAAPAWRAGLTWPRLPEAAEAAIVGAGYLGYALVRLAVRAGRHAAFAHAAELWRAERWLHLDVEPSLNPWWTRPVAPPRYSVPGMTDILVRHYVLGAADPHGPAGW